MTLPYPRVFPASPSYKPSTGDYNGTPVYCAHLLQSLCIFSFTAGIFSDCGINHLANQKHKWREVISFFEQWEKHMAFWQDLAVVLFMWHYILYLEFHINCLVLIEGIEHLWAYGQSIYFVSIYNSKQNRGKITCLVLILIKATLWTVLRLRQIEENVYIWKYVNVSIDA